MFRATLLCDAAGCELDAELVGGKKAGFSRHGEECGVDGALSLDCGEAWVFTLSSGVRWKLLLSDCAAVADKDGRLKPI